jgi:hypothetical protein
MVAASADVHHVDLSSGSSPHFICDTPEQGGSKIQLAVMVLVHLETWVNIKIIGCSDLKPISNLLRGTVPMPCRQLTSSYRQGSC